MYKNTKCSCKEQETGVKSLKFFKTDKKSPLNNSGQKLPLIVGTPRKGTSLIPCGVNDFFVFDIEQKNTPTGWSAKNAADEIVKDLDKNSYFLQKTQSGGFHVVVKTKEIPRFLVSGNGNGISRIGKFKEVLLFETLAGKDNFKLYKDLPQILKPLSAAKIEEAYSKLKEYKECFVLAQNQKQAQNLNERVQKAKESLTKNQKNKLSELNKCLENALNKGDGRKEALNNLGLFVGSQAKIQGLNEDEVQAYAYEVLKVRFPFPTQTHKNAFLKGVLDGFKSKKIKDYSKSNLQKNKGKAKENSNEAQYNFTISQYLGEVQNELLSIFSDAYSKAKETKEQQKILLIAPTGSGKTYTVCSNKTGFLKSLNLGNSAYFAVPLVSLCEQVSNEFSLIPKYGEQQDIATQERAKNNFKSTHDLEKNVYCCTYDSANKLKEEKFSFAFLDEAHNLGQAKYRGQALTKLGQKTGKADVLCEITATPDLPISEFKRQGYIVIKVKKEAKKEKEKVNFTYVHGSKKEAYRQLTYKQIVQNLEQSDLVITKYNQTHENGDGGGLVWLRESLLNSNKLKPENVAIVSRKLHEGLKVVSNRVLDCINEGNKNLNVPKEIKVLLITSAVNDGVSIYAEEKKVSMLHFASPYNYTPRVSEVIQFFGRVRKAKSIYREVFHFDKPEIRMLNEMEAQVKNKERRQKVRVIKELPRFLNVNSWEAKRIVMHSFFNKMYGKTKKQVWQDLRLSVSKVNESTKTREVWNTKIKELRNKAPKDCEEFKFYQLSMREINKALSVNTATIWSIDNELNEAKNAVKTSKTFGIHSYLKNILKDFEGRLILDFSQYRMNLETHYAEVRKTRFLHYLKVDAPNYEYKIKYIELGKIQNENEKTKDRIEKGLEILRTLSDGDALNCLLAMNKQDKIVKSEMEKMGIKEVSTPYLHEVFYNFLSEEQGIFDKIRDFILHKIAKQQLGFLGANEVYSMDMDELKQDKKSVKLAKILAFQTQGIDNKILLRVPEIVKKQVKKNGNTYRFSQLKALKILREAGIPNANVKTKESAKDFILALFKDSKVPNTDVQKRIELHTLEFVEMPNQKHSTQQIAQFQKTHRELFVRNENENLSIVTIGEKTYTNEDLEDVYNCKILSLQSDTEKGILPYEGEDVDYLNFPVWIRESVKVGELIEITRREISQTSKQKYMNNVISKGKKENEVWGDELPTF